MACKRSCSDRGHAAGAHVAQACCACASLFQQKYKELALLLLPFIPPRYPHAVVCTSRPSAWQDLSCGPHAFIAQCHELVCAKLSPAAQMVFSSSCTVYGNPEKVPIDEDHPLKAVSPYGRTKLIIEDMFRDVAAAEKEWHTILLRYFNPVGAHPSGAKLGSLTRRAPQLAAAPKGLPCCTPLSDASATPERILHVQATEVASCIHCCNYCSMHGRLTSPQLRWSEHPRTCDRDQGYRGSQLSPGSAMNPSVWLAARPARRQNRGAPSGHPQQPDALRPAGGARPAPVPVRLWQRLPHARWHVRGPIIGTPYVTLPFLSVFGGDYPTRDGTYMWPASGTLTSTLSDAWTWPAWWLCQKNAGLLEQWHACFLVSFPRLVLGAFFWIPCAAL